MYAANSNDEMVMAYVECHLRDNIGVQSSSYLIYTVLLIGIRFLLFCCLVVRFIVQALLQFVLRLLNRQL